jgi:hypothetical protein
LELVPTTASFERTVSLNVWQTILALMAALGSAASGLVAVLTYFSHLK